jgi:type I restriction enzyme S subunit
MTLVLSPAEIIVKLESEGKLGLLSKHESWPRRQLGELCVIQNGAPFKSSFFNNEGIGVPVIRIRDVGKDVTETWYSGGFDLAYLVSKGNILVGMDGDFRLSRWAGEPGLLNQRVCRIKVDTTTVFEKYVELVVPGYLEAIWNETSSTTVKHLSSRSISEIPIPIPPLEEQSKIVEILEEHFSRLDAALASVRAVRENSARFRRSLLQAGFNGELTGHDASEGNIPDGWTAGTIGDVADFIRGVTYQKSDARREAEDGYLPLIRATNIGSESITYDEFVYVPKRVVKEDQLIRVNDMVLAASSGSITVVGKSAPVLSDFEATFGAFCAVLRPREVISPNYFRLYVQSPICRETWSNLARGTNINNLKREQVLTTTMPVPPLDEQLKIAAILDEQLSRIDASLAVADVIETKASALRRSLLHAAFTGELTKEWREGAHV